MFGISIQELDAELRFKARDMPRHASLGHAETLRGRRKAAAPADFDEKLNLRQTIQNSFPNPCLILHTALCVQFTSNVQYGPSLFFLSHHTFRPKAVSRTWNRRTVHSPTPN